MYSPFSRRGHISLHCTSRLPNRSAPYLYICQWIGLQGASMKKRVILRATGEVQKVGYRDFVQKVARKLGIVG
ncbi:MAG: acylphosphatase, partial [Candidatus Thermoplasmatota archaeon]